jgi:hypothetical protein
VPVAMLEALSGVAREAGIELPGTERLVPKVNIDQSVREIAIQLGGLLKRLDIFRLGQGREVVTVEGGRIVPMDAMRFRTWIQKHVTTFKNTRDFVKEETLGIEATGTVLKCDDFLAQIPQLTGIAPVRLPVMRDGGVELLEPGFDEATGVFCEDAVGYRTNMELEEALEVFDRLLRDFDFPDGKWNESRSGAVQFAAMVGSYCRWMFEPGTIRPQIVYSANQPGSGKSLLVSMVLSAVEGLGASTDFPLSPRGGIDEGKISEILAMTARNREASLWFDDSPPWIKSNSLNKFVTSARHKGRILGKATGYDEESVTQVYITGNMIEVTPDLMRRSLVCELFVPGDASEKTPQEVLTAKILAQPGRRAELLAACWAVVSCWDFEGRPTMPGGPAGFEDWMGPINGMASVAGLRDPGERPDLPMSGDTTEKEFRELFISLADAIADDADEEARSITPDQVVEEARAMEILTDLVGFSGDSPPDAKQKRRLGTQMKRYRGRQFRDSNGRLFEFGQRKQRSGSVYPVTFL